jgi:hypothetical protein
MRLRAPALDSRRDISFAQDGTVTASVDGVCRIALKKGSAAFLHLTRAGA